MIIHVTADGRLRLDEADDFKGFHIAGSRPASPAALAAGGVHLDDDLGHGWVEPEAVRRLAGGGAEWDKGFAAMVDYARTKGWTDDSGRLRAHAEWDPQASASW